MIIEEYRGFKVEANETTFTVQFKRLDGTIAFTYEGDLYHEDTDTMNTIIEYAKSEFDDWLEDN